MVLEVRNLVKRVKGFSLKNISFTVNREYYVILGPSGAGKTMLLECIAGLRKVDSGKIFLDGDDITDKPPEKRNISMVFQEISLFPNMTVRENIEYGLKIRGVPREERLKSVEEIARVLRIEKHLDKMPQKLSGGEKQRVALARGLVVKPKVLLLDEPLSKLDAPLRKELKVELRRIHREFGIPFIHVTHDQLAAFTLADKIAVIKDGRIVEEGTPKQIFSNPKKLDTARFVGFENIYNAKVIYSGDGYSKILVNGKIEINVLGEFSGDIKIGIRPDDILITTKPVKTTAGNILEGTIMDVIDENYYYKLVIDAGVEIKAIVPKTSFYEMDLDVGKKVYLIFAETKIKVF